MKRILLFLIGLLPIVASSQTPISNQFLVQTPKPVDSRIGKFVSGQWQYYTSVSDANNHANNPLAYRYKGMTIPILIGGVVNDYWYRDTIINSGLVLKSIDSTALAVRFAAKQNTLTLTTTGTSGAATLIGSTLNIPTPSGGGGGGSVPYVNIACVGDSKTYGSHLTDTSQSWPTVLRGLYKGQPVKVKNLGSGGAPLVGFDANLIRAGYDSSAALNICIFYLGTNDMGGGLPKTIAQIDTAYVNWMKFIKDTVKYDRVFVIAPGETGHWTDPYDVYVKPDYYLFADFVQNTQFRLKVDGYFLEPYDPWIGQCRYADNRIGWWDTPEGSGLAIDFMHDGPGGNRYRAKLLKPMLDRLINGDVKPTLLIPANWKINNRVQAWDEVPGATTYEITANPLGLGNDSGKVVYSGPLNYFIDSLSIGNKRYFYSLRAVGVNAYPSMRIPNDTFLTGGRNIYIAHTDSRWRLTYPPTWQPNANFKYCSPSTQQDTSVCGRIEFKEGFSFSADAPYIYDGSPYLFRVYRKSDGVLLFSKEVTASADKLNKVLCEYHSLDMADKLLYVGRGAAAGGTYILVAGVTTFSL